MKTVATIPIGDNKPTLHVDILDPPALAIRREGGGLVRIEAHEVRHLAEVLGLASGELAERRAGEVDNVT